MADRPWNDHIRSDAINMTGKKYPGSCLTVLRRARRNLYWVCRCDCGTVKEVRGQTIREGRTRSCGCGGARTTHRMSHLPEYHSWQRLAADCRAAGLPVCERWRSFENFYADMGPRPTPGSRLCRRDHAAGMSPENCFWGDSRQQFHGSPRARLLTYRGETKTVPEWALLNGICPEVLAGRLRLGWTGEKLFAPVHVCCGKDPAWVGRFLALVRKGHTIAAACVAIGVSYSCLRHGRKANAEFDRGLRELLAAR